MEQANVEGDSDEFVTFDPKLKSFVAWLKGKPGDKRVVKLSGALPISRDGDQKQLELDVSTAAKSSIDIIAPSAVQADESANLVVVSQSQSKDQATTRIDGIKQPVVLRWGPPGSRRTRETSMFEATADMIVNVEPGRLSYDANISVQGFGKPIESIRVELPKGATASVAPESDGATLSMLPPDKKAAGPVAEIRFK